MSTTTATSKRTKKAAAKPAAPPAAKSSKPVSKASAATAKAPAPPAKKRKPSASRRPAPSISVEPLTHELIAREAFLIWEASGRPQGEELTHWLEAERRLADTSARTA